MSVGTEDRIAAAVRHVDKHKMVQSTGIVPGWLGQLTRQDAQQLMLYASMLDDVSSWVVADLLLWAEQRCKRDKNFWANREEAWTQLLENTKMDIGLRTAYNMRTVAKAFAWHRRRHTEQVSFEHHRLVAHLDPEEADYWLDRCEYEQWTTTRLRAELYSKNRPDVDAGTAVPEMVAAAFADAGIAVEPYDKHGLRFVWHGCHSVTVVPKVVLGRPTLELAREDVEDESRSSL